MPRRPLILAVPLLGLAGCGPAYSPDSHPARAAQQANTAEQGVVVGVRRVEIRMPGPVSAITGRPAGGLTGVRSRGGRPGASLAIDGRLLDGLAGAAAGGASANTPAFEYIVRKIAPKTGPELVSVTQADEVPLTRGQKVLVIAGNQARVVADTLAEQSNAPEKPGGAAIRPARAAADDVTTDNTSSSNMIPATGAATMSAAPQQALPAAPAS